MAELYAGSLVIDKRSLSEIDCFFDQKSVIGTVVNVQQRQLSIFRTGGHSKTLRGEPGTTSAKR